MTKLNLEQSANILTMGRRKRERKGGADIIFISLASLGALIALDGFFDRFDFCPICGGDGQTFQMTLGKKTSQITNCPLLLIKPDWHSGMA